MSTGFPYPHSPATPEAEDHAAAAREIRQESVAEQADRNLGELLQETRVLQTGTQVMAGFLLTLPFQSRFDALSTPQIRLFLVAAALSVVTVLLLVAPVSVHRALFHRGRKPQIVRLTHIMASAGLVSLAATMVSVVALMFSVVLGWTAAFIAAGVTLVGFVALWWLLPLSWRSGD